MSGAADKHLLALLQKSSFAQLRSDVRSPTQQKVVAYLQMQAQRTNSRVLSAVAVRASEDPFVKVKKMIKDMIIQLTEEANEEAEQKGWCDGELSTNEQTRKEKRAHAAATLGMPTPPLASCRQPPPHPSGLCSGGCARRLSLDAMGCHTRLTRARVLDSRAMEGSKRQKKDPKSWKNDSGAAVAAGARHAHPRPHPRARATLARRVARKPRDATRALRAALKPPMCALMTDAQHIN